jgi:hypothetical protein
MDRSKNAHLFISEKEINHGNSPILTMADSMELGPSWEVNSCSAIKEIPRMLQNISLIIGSKYQNQLQFKCEKRLARLPENLKKYEH